MEGLQPAPLALSVEEVYTHPVKRKGREREKDAGEGIADEGADQGHDPTNDRTFEGAPSASGLHASPSSITTTLPTPVPAAATSRPITNPPMAEGTGFTAMLTYPAYGVNPPTTALPEATTTSESVTSSSAARWYAADYHHPLPATSRVEGPYAYGGPQRRRTTQRTSTAQSSGNRPPHQPATPPPAPPASAPQTTTSPPPPTDSDHPPPEIWVTALERGHYYVIAATATCPGPQWLVKGTDTMLAPGTAPPGAVGDPTTQHRVLRGVLRPGDKPPARTLAQITSGKAGYHLGLAMLCLTHWIQRR